MVIPVLTWRKLFVPIFLGLLGGTLWPQSATEPGGQSQPSPPVVKAQNRLVVIDVVAHDQKGQIVRNLNAGDFKVLEDGKPQAISVFVFQQPGVGPEQPATEPLPLNVFGNVPRFNSKSALNVILLDALNTNLLNQAYVRSQMVSFVEKLPQGQPVAVYALGSKLRL